MKEYIGMSILRMEERNEFWNKLDELLDEYELIDKEVHFKYIKCTNDTLYEIFKNIPDEHFLGVNVSSRGAGSVFQFKFKDMELINKIAENLSNPLEGYVWNKYESNKTNHGIYFKLDSERTITDATETAEKFAQLIRTVVPAVYSVCERVLGISSNVKHSKYSKPRKMKHSSREIAFPKALTPSRQMIELANRGVAFDANWLIKLDEANSQIIERLIVEGIPGSSKKYVSSPTLYDNVNPEDYKYNRDAVYSWVRNIDKSNGTMDYMRHFSACEFYTDWILNEDNNFYSKLDGNESTVKNLVNEMYNAFAGSTNGYNAASLASKVCKYLHEKFYGHDKFYINDSVVRSVLPYFLDKYHINANLARMDYTMLYDLLKRLHQAACPTLSKTEFDHLLWFTYKAYNKI